MARAKRHYIPGYIWHITHRCHKREFPPQILKGSAPLFAAVVSSHEAVWFDCVIEGCEGYQLREGAAHYKPLFQAENDDIGPENTYLWDIKAE
jgi:hypothetical protein